MKYIYFFILLLTFTACGKEENPARKADRQCNCGKALLQTAQGKIPLSNEPQQRKKDFGAIYRDYLAMLACLSQEGEIRYSELKLGSSKAAPDSYEGQMYQSLMSKCPELVTVLDYLETLPPDIVS